MSYKVWPNSKLLGPGFGADFPYVAATFKSIAPTKIAAAVAANKEVTVATDINIPPELRTEGWACEIVRRIQIQRKNADFNSEDRIRD